MARTSVFILPMRKPRPREAERAQIALSEAGISLGLSCSEAGVLSIPPQRGWPQGAVTGRAQASAGTDPLWPQSSARPLTWGRASSSNQKNTYSLAGRAWGITNDKSYLLIICDFWGQPRFPFRDKYFLGDSFPLPPTQPPPPKRKAKRRSPRQLRSAAGPLAASRAGFLPGPVPSLHASSEILRFLFHLFWLLFSQKGF